MSRFFDVLKDSFKFFSAHPKIIIPKLFISLAYGAMIFISLGLGAQAVTAPTIALLFAAVLQLVFLFALTAVDIITSAMYPFLVADIAAKKNPSILLALKKVLSEPRKILLPAFVVEIAAILFIVFMVTVVILPMITDFTQVSDTLDDVDFTISGILQPVAALGVIVVAVLAIVFLFYSIYPVAAYEKGKVMDSLKRSVAISMKNKSEVAKATILSLCLSILTVIIAFVIEFYPQQEGTALFWAAFLIVRFLTAYVYTYMYVLSPVFYLNYAGKK